MRMTSGQIMSANPEALLDTETIRRAAEVMADAGVGFLPICDSRFRVVGVVTDRDLTVRALAKRIAPSTPVARVMSSPAITWPAAGDVRDAAELMSKERVSRLVITDVDNRLVGVLSLVDVVEKAHDRLALRTVRTLLARDALGPRGGARRDQPLLKDDPVARAAPAPSDSIKVRETVFTGGHRLPPDMREFPR